MKHQLALAAALAATAGAVHAQQAQPQFAAPNLTLAGTRALAATCAPCHGTEGRPAPGSTAGALAGRPASETEQALAAFRKGEKPGTLMPQLARGFTEAEAAALAAYFAKAAP